MSDLREQLEDARRALDWASTTQLNDKSPEVEAAYQEAYRVYRATFEAFIASPEVRV